ncbi:hypothetical protein GCM10027184_10680 [Saccharothrix stipae]
MDGRFGQLKGAGEFRDPHPPRTTGQQAQHRGCPFDGLDGSRHESTLARDRSTMSNCARVGLVPNRARPNPSARHPTGWTDGPRWAVRSKLPEGVAYERSRE